MVNHEERGAEIFNKASEKFYRLIGLAAYGYDKAAEAVVEGVTSARSRKEQKALQTELRRINRVLITLGDTPHPKAEELKERREAIKDELVKLIR